MWLAVQPIASVEMEYVEMESCAEIPMWLRTASLTVENATTQFRFVEMDYAL
jgi:hypothetical protein